jgi:hypothetical protein
MSPIMSNEPTKKISVVMTLTIPAGDGRSEASRQAVSC